MMRSVWYPGHVEKAKRQLRENLSKVDAVLILLDARAPVATGSFEIEMFRGKTKLLALGKSDLADRSYTKLWREVLAGYFPVVEISKDTSQREITEFLKIHLPSRNLRLAVVGVPNVGKSTVINKIAGRRRASTGAMPGVTRGVQWITLEHFILLDSPGILHPKIFNRSVAARLLLVGSIPAESAEPGLLLEAYEIYRNVSNEPKGFQEKLEEIGKKRGILKKGGVVDHDKVAVLFLRELSEGRYGRFTFDRNFDLMRELMGKLKSE